MEGQSSSQVLGEGASALPSPRELGETSQPGVRPLGLLGDWLCVDSQSSPGRVPELEGKGGPGTPADLGQTWAMERSGTEARRISVRKGWMLGTPCA